MFRRQTTRRKTEYRGSIAALAASVIGAFFLVVIIMLSRLDADDQMITFDEVRRESLMETIRGLKANSEKLRKANAKKSSERRAIATEPSTRPIKAPSNRPIFKNNSTTSLIKSQIRISASVRQTPTHVPTKIPTNNPTKYPTKSPTHVPTEVPTNNPTKYPTKQPIKVSKNLEGNASNNHVGSIDESLRFPHLPPHLMAIDLFGSNIINDTIHNSQPSIAGIIGIFQSFLSNIHKMIVEKQDATALQVIEAYFSIVEKDILPFEQAYFNRSIFPIREDNSIFVSLAAYRDHLLGETLRQAFKNAKYPNKLFVGAVVQNCFGLGGVQCRSGVEVVGTNKDGSPKTAVSDRPPDANGIEQFCTDVEYSKFCDAGQIRVLYVNETESNGPTTARYFASKLWGGETFFFQADAHLRFAPEWDKTYIDELQEAKSYPKAILSSYPPNFNEEDQPFKGGGDGARLCACEFSNYDAEGRIIRINTGDVCHGEQPRPTQVAFMAAGFFFARAEFLVDVPFDPYLPWSFMGEEISLSIRAWTHGWDIYAPRKNLIAHQYRPGKMGLPKVWENTARVFGKSTNDFDTNLGFIILQRIKHMIGYEEATYSNLEKSGGLIALTNYDHYGPGQTRTTKRFLEHSMISVSNYTCGRIDWCNQCAFE